MGQLVQLRNGPLHERTCGVCPEPQAGAAGAASVVAVFPMNAIAAEGIINTQTVVICDIDLGALEIERTVGNVRPLVARRPDIYVIENRITIEKCKIS
jgi:hypothetical protein